MMLTIFHFQYNQRLTNNSIKSFVRLKTVDKISVLWMCDLFIVASFIIIRKYIDIFLLGHIFMGTLFSGFILHIQCCNLQRTSIVIVSNKCYKQYCEIVYENGICSTFISLLLSFSHSCDLWTVIRGNPHLTSVRYRERKGHNSEKKKKLYCTERWLHEKSICSQNSLYRLIRTREGFNLTNFHFASFTGIKIQINGNGLKAQHTQTNLMG